MNGLHHIFVIVDDDDGVRELVADAMKLAGLAPASFSSAEDFIVHGHVEEAACVIVDSQLPGMDGGELIRWIRQRDRKLPIIFVSGIAGGLAFHSAKGSGADACFEKPFDIGALVSRARTLSQYRA